MTTYLITECPHCDADVEVRLDGDVEIVHLIGGPVAERTKCAIVPPTGVVECPAHCGARLYVGSAGRLTVVGVA